MAHDNCTDTMTYKQTFNAFWGSLALFLLAASSAWTQNLNPVSAKQVQELANHADYSEIDKLIDSHEVIWQKAPNIAYFQNMFAIGEILLGGTTEQSYWLGRKVIWKMLLKPTPNDYIAPQQFYLWRHTMFFLGAEGITPYVESLSPEMFAPVRHDTFLMLSEYARQLHATIIPGYRDKYTGGMAERHRFMQNAIDNEVQRNARIAISTLPTDHLNYLINAYSHDPRDDEELKQLFDILNIQSADRKRVIDQSR